MHMLCSPISHCSSRAQLHERSEAGTKQALFWKMLSTITETSLWEALTQSIYHLGQVAEHLGALWLQQSATTWVNQRINIYYEIS